MNKYRIKGSFTYMVGTVEEKIGKIFRNSRRQVKGYQRKVTGLAMIDLGNAQEALNLCVTSQLMELEEAAEQATYSRRLTSKT